jgi:phosphatidate cytidylyltransferase
MLKQRILTAVILGSVVISIITTGSLPLFSMLMGLFVVVGAWEWAGLSGSDNQLYRTGYAMLTAGLFYFLFFIMDNSYSHGIYIIGTLWWCLASVMVALYQCGRPAIPKTNTLKYLFGFFVLIPATLSLINLYGTDSGPLLVLLLFFLIWVIDSAAYFVGSCWGKKKLAYRVSPGKSWEGFLASLLAAGIMALVYVESGLITVTNTLYLIVLFIITAGFSVIGDLFESMYKRNANLKDSSQLLPGHGGVLDRIDSLTAAVPIYALVIWLLEVR